MLKTSRPFEIGNLLLKITHTLINKEIWFKVLNGGKILITLFICKYQVHDYLIIKTFKGANRTLKVGANLRGAISTLEGLP